ncbi:MAG: hypothetical protein R3B55_02060 [Candidatus Paceibacterota bacterium]
MESLNSKEMAGNLNNLDDIKKRMEEIEKEYPKLFGPRIPGIDDARYGLEEASTSEWINDEIEIIQEGESLVLKNLSQIEEIDTLVQDFKLKVADYAFELLKLRENGNLTPGKESLLLLGNIKEYKNQIENLDQKRKTYNIIVPVNPEGYNNPDKNTWLLHSMQFLKPENVYGKRMVMKDLISELKNQYFYTGLDEKTKQSLINEYSELKERLVDMHFEQRDNS